MKTDSERVPQLGWIPLAVGILIPFVLVAAVIVAGMLIDLPVIDVYWR